MKEKIALVIGATGATGTEIVKQLLEDSYYQEVHIFVRRAIDLAHTKLKVHEVDFNQINTWKEKIQGDVLFSALGTTLKTAGSKEAQFKIDYTYQHDVAKAASENEVPTLVLVSSVGASSKSPFFYPKIKGQLEEAVNQMNFSKVLIFQPPMLDRGEFKRKNEEFGIKVIGFFNKLGILKSQHPMKVSFLAQKMIKASKLSSTKKIEVFPPKSIFNL